MAQEDSPKEHTKTGRTKHPALFCLIIGCYEGLIWGMIHWLALSLEFTQVPQAFLADPFVRRSSLSSTFWQCTGLGLFVLMSIVAAYLYWLVLGKLQGPWPGLLFGAVWWIVLFLWLGPLTGAIAPIRKVGWNSIFTELCIYLMWGLFIGYTFAYEYHNEAEREPTGTAGAEPKTSGSSPQPAS